MIPLPLGISFFTFQIISYLIDVYHGEAENDFINFALYIMFFPQLIEEPIIRYKEISEKLKYRISIHENLEYGTRRFIMGFAWLGIICYSFVIYFDFSGYSDMAIGLSAIFGFQIAENFNYPYISKSIQEFWRRWHISFSSWFRDYVYIPLGGSRNGNVNTYRNLMIVFLLTGLWHGASWTFIFWGVFHGMFMLCERAGLKKVLAKLPSFFVIYIR